MARRTLIVANRTAATPLLLEEVSRRAAEGPTVFVLLVPATGKSDWTLEQALTALRRAVRGESGMRQGDVEVRPGGADPYEAVRQALDGGDFDDVLISTLPKKTSEWLRRDLPRRV